MVIAVFRFTHCGYSGSLGVSTPKLVREIQKKVNSGQRLELFLMLIELLLYRPERSCVDIRKNSTLMELKELYELSYSSVTIK